MELIEILKVVILGIIQGITEWLPISSTGHMILADTFLQLQQPKDFMDMFYVVIQLGSILAVVVLYFNKLNPFSRAKSRAERLSTFQLWFKVIVAILPIGVIGLLVDDWVTEHFYTPTVIAIALIFYGVLFILLEKRNHRVKPRIRNFEQLSYRTAVCIGILQLLAIIPGTSRSGSTILGAMLLSCSRFVATEFSFFMAIPVMFGASVSAAPGARRRPSRPERGYPAAPGPPGPGSGCGWSAAAAGHPLSDGPALPDHRPGSGP